MTVAAIASIALGGAAGSVFRHLLNRWIGQPDGLPLGILIVNLSGTLVLGLVATLFLERIGVSDNLRLAITVGLLGGFTTFSTVWLDTLHLLNGGRWGLGADKSGGLGSRRARRCLARTATRAALTPNALFAPHSSLQCV